MEGWSRWTRCWSMSRSSTTRRSARSEP
jgi:hypothetical protein